MPVLFACPSPAQISASIAKSKAAGASHHAPLLRALMADEIALAVMLPDDRLPLSILDPTRFPKPLVVLLGGDGITPDGSHDCGPEGWQQSRRLLRWSRWTLLHGTGGEEWHYDLAVAAARRFGRVLIAECGTATLPAWMDLKQEVAPQGAGIVLQCEPGDFHPRQRARAEGVA